MPNIDIFLYASEPDPNDIRLSDPTQLRSGQVVESTAFAEGTCYVFADSAVVAGQPQPGYGGGGGGGGVHRGGAVSRAGDGARDAGEFDEATQRDEEEILLAVITAFLTVEG